MSELHVMVWKDSSVKNNEVHGVLKITTSDLEMLLMAEFERQHGKKCTHAEIIGLMERDVDHGLPVFGLTVE